MPLNDRDQALLVDMRRAASEAIGFVKGMEQPAFLKDLRTQRAVEREIEILGEAARGLSDQARQQWPGIPFRAIIAMRNILAHDYGRVAPSELWVAVRESLPELLGSLQ